MSYVIKEITVDGACLRTLVEFTFADNTKREVEIPHFMPDDKAAVILGIENRESSEQEALDAAANNQLIKEDIKKSITPIR